MVCVHCNGKTQVINSRPQLRVNQIWRRRQCLKCGIVFSTHEGIDYSSTWVVREPSGRLRAFSRDKLFISLYNSCQHRSRAVFDATGLTDTIIVKLAAQTKDGAINSQTIIQVVQVALNRFDKVSSVHYRAFHQN